MTDIKHTKKGDLWVIIDSYVYDLSKFGAMHPGGLGVLLDAEVGMSLRPMIGHRSVDHSNYTNGTSGYSFKGCSFGRELATEMWHVVLIV